MKTRKIALLMVTLLLAFSTVLAGCGGSNTNDTSGNAASGEHPAVRTR